MQFILRFIPAIACMLIGSAVNGQKSGDYRSVHSGNWKALSSWKIYKDSVWITPSAADGTPSEISGITTIQPGHRIEISDTISTDQLIIPSGASVYVNGTGLFIVKAGPGTDALVTGELEVEGKLEVLGTLSLLANSKLKHKNSGQLTSNIFWHPYATIEFSSGGTTSWMPQVNTSLCKIVVTNNSTLDLSSKNEGKLVLGNGLLDDLLVESGSTLILQPSVTKLFITKSAIAKIKGTLINHSLIEIENADSGLCIQGKLLNKGSFSGNNALNLVLDKNATYEHSQDGGEIPLAKWATTSYCVLSGLNKKVPGGLNQVFGNVQFKSLLSADLLLSGSLDCSGNLSIENSGSGAIVINNGTTHKSIFVGGNFSIKAGNLVLVDSEGTGSVQIGGNFNQLGGIVTLKAAAGDAEIFVGGNMYKSDGSLNYRIKDSSAFAGLAEIRVLANLEYNGGTTDFSANTGIGELFVKGNFSFTGGTLTETGSGSGTIHFNNNGEQVFESGGKVLNEIHFIVDSLSFLQMASATTRITGNGSFVLKPGSGMGVRNNQGINKAALNYGQVVTPVRIYGPDAHIVFNGTINQYTGNGLENVPAASITFDNPNQVGLSSSIISNGDITFKQGSTLDYNFNFTLKGDWINNSKYNLGTNSLITFNGVNPQEISGSNLSNFVTLSMNNPAGVFLNQDIKVSNQLRMYKGNFTVGDHVLTLGSKSLRVASDSFSNRSMIVLGKSGQIRKEASLVTQATYYFPIGTLKAGVTYYSPIQLVFSNGTYSGFYSVQVIDEKHPQNPDIETYITRYWVVKQEGFKSFSAVIAAAFDSSDVVGDRDNLRFGKYSQTLPAIGWTSYPYPPTGNIFYVSGITAFSDFSGLGTTKTSDSVQNKTASNLRSINGTANTGINERSLFNGPPSIKIYSNPVKGKAVNLVLQNFIAGSYQISIINTSGQKIYAQMLDHPGGSLNVNLNLPAKQAPGIYRLQVLGSGEQMTTNYLQE